MIQLFILAAPAFLVGTLFLDIAYMAVIGCLERGGILDILISAGLGLGLAFLALASLAHHALLVLKAGRLLKDLPALSSPTARAILGRLAEGQEKKLPRLEIVPFDRPLAFTLGMFRPTIVLSQWVLDQLDEKELEGVLAHEWVHCLHRDNLVMTVAAWLRDCTFYLFFVNRALKSLLAEKELHADLRAAQITSRPAALASALYKFGQAPSLQLFAPAIETVVQGFGKDLIEPRIQALLGKVQPSETPTVHFWELILMLFFLVILAILPAYWMPAIH
ncbi:MAG TPA: M56 family metallopeptidase [Chroococcales cyanobacterium]